MDRTKKKIVMLGTHFDTMGGIASVINVYRKNGLFDRHSIVYIITHGDGSKSRKLRLHLSGWLRYTAMLLTGQISLIHVHMSSRAGCWRKLTFFLPAFALGVPTILHLHGSEFAIFYEHECDSVRKRIVRFLFDHASRVVVLSEEWFRWVRSITNNPEVKTIYNPVSFSQSETDFSGRQAGTVLFLGRLGKRKGTYDLLDAVADIRQSIPNIQLLLGGDGDLDQVKLRASEIGVAENIKLLGWVSGSDKEKLLNEASLYALPSYNEGLPMSVLEAMAAGLPVVSTYVGGIPEAVTNGVEGFLVQPGDVPALADAIKKLLLDNELCRRMGGAASAKVAQTFSAERILPQIEVLYTELEKSQSTSLGWKISRVRSMGLPEILYRFRKAAQVKMERYGFGIARAPAEPVGSYGRPWLATIPQGFKTGPYRMAADRILAGHFNIFALLDIELGFPPNWNRDPKTGTVAPMVFGKTFNYRDERIAGDIKYLWEGNRHLELVTLAQSFHCTGEKIYADGCRTLLDSWFEQCPYPLGANWTSALEHAVRLVNWSFAWHLLGGDDSQLFAGEAGQAFHRRWVDSVFQHCHFIAGHFSHYSSANNHLFGEYMGLFVGAVTWPLWKASIHWRDLAKAGLEEEALKQTSADGVNCEQATWYHHEVMDMMVLCGLIGQANNVEFIREYWDRLEAMLEYIASIMDVTGNVPMIGDSDDAVMVRFVPETFSQSAFSTVNNYAENKFHVYRSLLATGAILFNRSDFKAKAERFDDKSRWLLGDTAAKDFDALPTDSLRPPVRRAFPQGGYYILGDRFETPEELRIVADAGQLGYLSIAAHGHADALAFTLSVGGREFMIDPGTYAYHTQKKWRDYFRGTSAHNTVRVDYSDQSVAAGNFLWLKHAMTRCLSFETVPERDLWIGEHNGYERLTDPVTHRREIVLEKIDRRVCVTDHLICRNEHHIELHWHFAEDCVIQIQDDHAVVRSDDTTVRMVMPDVAWRPELVMGQDSPPLGWVSRRFDEKQAAPCIRWAGNITNTSVLVTDIRIET